MSIHWKGLAAIAAVAVLGSTLLSDPATAQWDDQWGYNEGLYDSGIGDNDWYYDRYGREPAYRPYYGGYDDYSNYYDTEDDDWLF